MASTDLELLERWRAGDATAGNALVERHFSAIYRFFRNKVRADIEDLVQRVFLACVESRDRFRGDASFRSYLFRVARNELFRRYRTDGRLEDFGSRSMAEHDPGPSPTEALARRREHRVLLRALRSLALDDQIALELFYWEKLSGSDLAIVLGVPEGTARTRLRRARASLDERIAALTREGEGLRTTTDSIDRWVESLRDLIRREAGGDG